MLAHFRDWQVNAANAVSRRAKGAQRAQARASGVREALRVDDLLEPAEHVHAGQKLRQAAVRLALLLDRCDELAVLELDAVHRDVHFGDVDLVVLSVRQVVVKGLEGAVVADVAEEAAERPVALFFSRMRRAEIRRDPHPVAVLQQQCAAGLVLPLHRR